MPETLEVNGESKVYYTEAEFKEKEEAASRAADLETTVSSLREIIKPADGQDLLEVVKDLAEDPNNRNWRTTRETIKSMKVALANAGVQVAEDGTITENKNNLSREDIERIASDKAAETMRAASNDALFGNMTEADKALVKPIFDKLQNVDGDTTTNFSIAFAKAFPGRQAPDPVRAAYNNTGGGAPLPTDKTETYADSADGKNAGANMGLRSFNQPTNK